MKKSFFLPLVGSLSIIFLIISCTTENIENYEKSVLDIKIEKFDEVGIIHNEGLDFIFGEINKLIHESIEMDLTESEILRLSKSANKIFVNSFDLCDESITYVYSHVDRVFSNQQVPVRESFVDLSADKVDIQFSESLTQFLEMLHSAMLDDTFDVYEKILSVENIEALSLKELCTDDLDIFLSATSVAKHTLAYWDANIMKWMSSLNSNGPLSAVKSDFCWKNLAVEDVAGAVGGAAGAKVAAFFGPIGWKAMAGIIGGAATANSVKYAVATIMSEESNTQEDSE